MNLELKMAIIVWLVDNEKVWNLTNACVENFREYIYDKDGNFLKYGIGEEVHNFILKAEKLLYGKED